MKAITKIFNIFGIIIILVLLIFFAVPAFSLLFNIVKKVGCGDKQMVSVSEIIRKAITYGSFNQITFRMPDCVEAFKAINYEYCFRETREFKCTFIFGPRCWWDIKEYKCFGTGENVFFNIPERTTPLHCFDVYGIQSPQSPSDHKHEPYVEYAGVGAC